MPAAGSATPVAPAAAPSAAATAAAPAKGDAWSPRALLGPVASLEDWCHGRPKADPCISIDEANAKAATLAKPAPPLVEGRWLVTGNAEEKTARLALRTAAGWFISRPIGESGLLVRPVEIVPHMSAPKLVTAKVVTTWNASDNPDGNGRWQQHCQENLVVCGVGPSGTPSCTRAIAARDGECDDPAKAIDWSYSLDVNVLPGSLEVSAPKGAKLTAGSRSALGKHPLVLP